MDILLSTRCKPQVMPLKSYDYTHGKPACIAVLLNAQKEMKNFCQMMAQAHRTGSAIRSVGCAAFRATKRKRRLLGSSFSRLVR